MILLVGATVRTLMESAVGSGFEVMGIDFFGDIDSCWQGKTISLSRDCNLQATVTNLLKVAEIMGAQGLVYAAGPENHPDKLRYWEQRGELLGNGTTVLQNVRNPWKMKKALEDLQITGEIQAKMPEFYSIKDWRKADKEHSWLLKPLNRGGGHGIIKLPGGAANESLTSILPDRDNYIIQEYIEGIPVSATFLANGREAVLLGSSRQLTSISEKAWMKANTYTYIGNIVPLNIQNISISISYTKEVTSIIQHLTTTFGLRGINTLDLIINSKGTWILELNPRWSGSVELIEKHLGKNLFSHHLAACAGKSFDSTEFSTSLTPTAESSRNTKYWGKEIIYSSSSFQVMERAELELRSLYHDGIRDIPMAGTEIQKGQPICTVIASGRTEQACVQSLQAKSEWIRTIWGG